VAACIAITLLPQLVTSTYYRNILVVGLLYAVVACSWDLTLGYAGVFNFAQVATFGVGSYATGILALRGVPPLVSMLIAVIVGVVFNAVVAIPVLRLRGVYVALLTFGAAQLAGSVALGWTSVTGGSTGLVLVPDLIFGRFDFNISPTAYLYTAEILLACTVGALHWLVRSPFGRSLVAGRDAEDYAASRGIPLGRQRVLALAVGAAFASAAGAVFAMYLSSASPTIFGFSTATLVLSMVLVGGAGTIYGPALAAVALTVLQNTRGLAGLGPVTFMVIAVLILLVLRFLPGGLGDIGKTARRVYSWRRGGQRPEPGDVAALSRDDGGEDPVTAAKGA
jgi:branched-chain amino acid transport system permease protein